MQFNTPLVYAVLSGKPTGKLNITYMSVLSTGLSSIRLVNLIGCAAIPSLLELWTVAREFRIAVIMVNYKAKGLLLWKVIVEVLQSTLTLALFCSSIKNLAVFILHSLFL